MTFTSISKKSLSEERIQRISSHEQLADLLFEDKSSFFSLLNDQSSGSLRVWRERLGELGHKGTFFAAAYCNYFGVLPEEYEDLTLRLNLSNNELFWTKHGAEDYGVTWYQAPTPFPAALAVDFEGRDVIRPFPCEFRDLPIQLCRVTMNTRERGTPGVFALYLPPEEMRHITFDLESPVENPHVLGAFGYIRYYQKGSEVEIAEIQSDYFEGLTTRALKERYKHWEELLLLGFEKHLNHKYQGALHSYNADLDAIKEYLQLSVPDLDFLLMNQTRRTMEACQKVSEAKIAGERVISIPLPGTIRSRWVKPHNSLEIELFFSDHTPENINRSAVPRGLAEHIYWRVPDRLSYRGELSRAPYFIERSNEDQIIPQLLTLQKRLPKSAEDSFRRTEGEMFFDTLTEVGSDRKYQLEQSFKKVFPKSIFRPHDWDGFPISFPIHRGLLRSTPNLGRIPGITMAPFEPSNLGNIPGVTEASLSVLEKYRTSPNLSLLSDMIQPEFTFFSLGIENGLSVDWWNLANSPANHTFRGMAIADQKRHPSVRLYNPVEENHDERPTITIGSKGAGLTERIPHECFLYESTRVEGVTFPITLPERVAEGDVGVPSHQYWGGMSVQHAEAEFRNHLGLWYLFDALQQNPLERVAFPLNVGVLHAIPVIKSEGISWMPNHEYCTGILDAHSYDRVDHLGVFISASACDVRLSQVINRIFSRSVESSENIDACEYEIKSALKYLFEVNGRAFIEGKAGLSIGKNGIGAREFQQYVNQLLEPNKSTGIDLYKKLSHRILTSVGMVHGAGGHLGGGYDGKIGAIGGGATALRNIDCCGALHDLDLDVFLPWISPEMRVSQAELNTAQIFDLLFLKDTLYWLETLFLGRNVAPSESMQTLVVGTPFNKCTFFGNAPLRSGNPWSVIGVTKENERSNQPSLFSMEDSAVPTDVAHEFRTWHLTSGEMKIFHSARSQGVGFSRLKKNVKKLRRQSEESSPKRQARV